jgi:hypothetical protein
MANNSPQVSQLRAFQNMANISPQAKQTAQLQAMADNHSSQPQPIQKKENNTGLPDSLKTGVENLSGMSLDDVKVHRNSDKPSQLQAHAYAQGTDIHLGPGQEKHLPHEAWHVVQQKQGRVKPTMQMKGKVNINDDAELEKEADAMGAKALQMKLKEDSILTSKQKIQTVSNPIQRVILGDERRMADHKYRRFFEYYYNSQKVYDLSGWGLDAFIAFLDSVDQYWDLAGVNPDLAYDMFLVHMQMGVTTKSGFEEAFADAGVEDHGYDVTNVPAEFDGSTAVIQQKRNPGPSGAKNYLGFTDMLFQKTNPKATIDFDAGLLNSSSKNNNKPDSLVDLNNMITGGKVNDTIIDPHKGNITVKCPRAGAPFDTSNRDQHFALADMLYYINHGSKPNRAETWTWHHLETPYQMVLVDMAVHAKHGHNGGVYLW